MNHVMNCMSETSVCEKYPDGRRLFPLRSESRAHTVKTEDAAALRERRWSRADAVLQVCVGGVWPDRRRGVASRQRRKNPFWEDDWRKWDGGWPQHLLTSLQRRNRYTRNTNTARYCSHSRTLQTPLGWTGERGGAGGGACPGENTLSGAVRTSWVI